VGVVVLGGMVVVVWRGAKGVSWWMGVWKGLGIRPVARVLISVVR
jgi:hypothetical protein